MTRLYIGAVLERLPPRRYCEQLPFCEFAPRAPLPRPSTLRRWHFGRHHDTQVGLLAPRACLLSDDGKLQLSRIPEERFTWLCRAAEAVGAIYVRVVTGREVSPGARDRERLAELCTALAERAQTRVVWSPGGVWEPETAAEQAERMGTGLSLDVLEHPLPPAETAYASISAIGTRAKLGRGHLEAGVRAVIAGMPATAYLAIEAEPALAKARTARDIAAELADEGESVELAPVTARERS